MSLQLRQWFFLDPIDPYHPLYDDEDIDFIDFVVENDRLRERRNILFERISIYMDLSPLQEVKTFWRKGYRKLSTIGHSLLPFRYELDDQCKLTVLCDLAELLTMLQHGDMFFHLLVRYVKMNELRSIRIHTLTHLLSTNSPFSLCLMDEQLTALQLVNSNADWTEKVYNWLALLVACKKSYRGVVYIEKHLYQLLSSHRTELAATFDHVELYRAVFQAASDTLRLSLSNIFGQPVESEMAAPSSTVRLNDVLPLTDIAFNCAYNYYEYRNVLRHYLQLISLYSPTDMQRKLNAVLDNDNDCYRHHHHSLDFIDTAN